MDVGERYNGAEMRLTCTQEKFREKLTLKLNNFRNFLRKFLVQQNQTFLLLFFSKLFHRLLQTFPHSLETAKESIRPNHAMSTAIREMLTKLGELRAQLADEPDELAIIGKIEGTICYRLSRFMSHIILS